jgi:hypothetical protein
MMFNFMSLLKVKNCRIINVDLKYQLIKVNEMIKMNIIQFYKKITN